MRDLDAPRPAIGEERTRQSRNSRLTAIWRNYRGSLTLFGLGALAVSQPILSDLRADAGYFVARRVEPLEVVVFVVAVTLAPGIAANLIASIARAISTASRVIVQAAMVGIFVILLGQTILVRVVALDWVVPLVASIAAGVAVAVVYYRSERVRDAFVWFTPAPLIIAGFFLLTPPVLHLVVPPSFADVEVDGEPTAPVVFVVFDELPLVSLLDRGGEIDADRYPNFAALAETSTWYKYTATVHESTFWAMPAILTGQVPSPARLPTTSDYPGNLFTLLHESHDLHVVESFTNLCPPAMCGEVQAPTTFGLRFGSLVVDSARLYSMIIAPQPSEAAPILDRYIEFVDNAETRLGSEATPDHPAMFGEFLNDITGEGSSLDFAHVLLPHFPYRYYPSGAQYVGSDRLDGQVAEMWFNQDLAEQAYQRHLLQAQYVDDLVGQLLTRLEEVGILDDAVVVVTADHGASFRVDTSRRVVSDGNAYEIGMVPLFIKAPHQSSGIVDTTPARTIDVLPTVADHLAIELPWLHEGQPLTRDSRRYSPLQVEAPSGEKVELDDVAEGVLDATEYAYSIFGDGKGRIDPYSLGNYDSLIGRAPEEVSTGSSTLEVHVEDLWRFDHISESIGFLPGFVRGEVVGDVEPDVHIAIALNGRIRTVVPVMEGDEITNFSAILPEHAFAPGFNDLTLMSATGPIDSPKVESIELDEQQEFRLEPGSSGEPGHLVDGDGRTWELTEEQVITGYVEGTNWYPNEAVSATTDLVVAGWAVDKLEMRPAERVVFFVDGVFGGSVEPDVEREHEDRRIRFRGFRGQVSHFLQAESCELRVFALAGASATELDVSDRAQDTFLGC